MTSMRMRIERLRDQLENIDARTELAAVFGIPVGKLSGIPAEQARGYLEALREFGKDAESEGGTA